jgi:hypothetical protein
MYIYLQLVYNCYYIGQNGEIEKGARRIAGLSLDASGSIVGIIQGMNNDH